MYTGASHGRPLGEYERHHVPGGDAFRRFPHTPEPHTSNLSPSEPSTRNHYRDASPLTDIPSTPALRTRTSSNDQAALQAIEAELLSLINGPVKSPTMVRFSCPFSLCPGFDLYL